MLMTVIFLLLLIPHEDACSCFPFRTSKMFCSSKLVNVIEVKLTHIIEHIPSSTSPSNQENFSREPREMTPAPASGYDDYYSRLGGRRDVGATITRVFKGNSRVGQEVVLTSPLMGSLCGIGYSLNPGNSYILSAPDPTVPISVGLCGFFFQADDAEAVQVIENVDCSCQPKECKLRIKGSRKVFRGSCADPSAYCSRDEAGSCRWKGVDSIDCCTSLKCYYRGK